MSFRNAPEDADRFLETHIVTIVVVLITIMFAIFLSHTSLDLFNGLKPFTSH